MTQFVYKYSLIYGPGLQLKSTQMLSFCQEILSLRQNPIPMVTPCRLSRLLLHYSPLIASVSPTHSSCLCSAVIQGDPFHIDFKRLLIDLLLNLDDGGSMFFRNVSKSLPDYMASAGNGPSSIYFPRKQNKIRFLR